MNPNIRLSILYPQVKRYIYIIFDLLHDLNMKCIIGRRFRSQNLNENLSGIVAFTDPSGIRSDGGLLSSSFPFLFSSVDFLENKSLLLKERFTFRLFCFLSFFSRTFFLLVFFFSFHLSSFFVLFLKWKVVTRDNLSTVCNVILFNRDLCIHLFY